MTSDGSVPLPFVLTILVSALVTVGLCAVAYLARRDARETWEMTRRATEAARDAQQRAESAEEHARQASEEAALTAHHVERTAELAELRRAEQDARRLDQRRFEEHDRAGPDFELVGVRGSSTDRAVGIDLRVVGGPPVIDVDIEALTPWCRALSIGSPVPGQPHDRSIGLTEIQPRSVFRFLATIEQRASPPEQLTLALSITARPSPAESDSAWRRSLSIQISP